MMPNNTITDYRGPEGHAFCVCSVSVVDKTVGNSLCVDEVRNTADCLWQSSPVFNNTSSERQEPQDIKTLKTEGVCGSENY